MYVANLSVPTEDDEDKGAGVQKTAVTSGAVKPMVSVPQPGALAGGAATSSVLAPQKNALAPEDPVAAAQADKQKGDALAAAQDKARDAEIEAKKDEIRKTQEATTKSDAAQAADEKAALDAKQARDIEAKKFRPEPAKPIPYKSTKPTSLVDQWGSSAMLIAMLGSMFTRGHAVTALNAAAAAMNGFKQGDEAAAKQAMEEWKVANQNMLDTANYQQKVYDNIMKDANDASQYDREINTAKGKARAAELKAAALSFQDNTLLKHMETEKAENVFKEYERGKKTSAEAEVAAEKLKTILDERAYNEVSSKWTDKTPVEQQISEAFASKTVKGRTEAIRMENSERAKKAALAANLAALNDDPEYIKAKETNDYQTMLMMRADAGEPRSQTKVANLLERKAKGQLTPEEIANQEVSDQMIASYQAKMGERPTRDDTSGRAYDARLARVSKIAKNLGYDFDPNEYDRVRKFESDWRDAKSYPGRQMTSINTLSGHLNEAHKLVDALKAFREGALDQATWNNLTRNYAKFTGQPDEVVEAVNAASKITMDELVKFILGGPGALGDREAMESLMKATNQTDVTKINLNVLDSYVIERAKALEQSFMSATREDESGFAKLLSPTTLQRYGKNLRIPASLIDTQVKRENAATERANVGGPSAPTSGAAGGAAGGAPAAQQRTPPAAYPNAEWSDKYNSFLIPGDNPGEYKKVQ